MPFNVTFVICEQAIAPLPKKIELSPSIGCVNRQCNDLEGNRQLSGLRWQFALKKTKLTNRYKQELDEIGYRVVNRTQLSRLFGFICIVSRSVRFYCEMRTTKSFYVQHVFVSRWLVCVAIPHDSTQIYNQGLKGRQQGSVIINSVRSLKEKTPCDACQPLSPLIDGDKK